MRIYGVPLWNIPLRQIAGEVPSRFVRCAKSTTSRPFCGFFSEKALQFLRNRVIVVSNKGRMLDTYLPLPLFFFLFSPSYFCYFLHLPSYHLPCLPERAKKRWPICTGSSLFFYLFCRQPGERLPDVAGKVEGAEGTDRAVPAQLDGAGDPGGDVRSRFRPAAPGADVLS